MALPVRGQSRIFVAEQVGETSVIEGCGDLVVFNQKPSQSNVRKVETLANLGDFVLVKTGKERYDVGRLIYIDKAKSQLQLCVTAEQLSEFFPEETERPVADLAELFLTDYSRIIRTSKIVGRVTCESARTSIGIGSAKGRSARPLLRYFISLSSSKPAIRPITPEDFVTRTLLLVPEPSASANSSSIELTERQTLALAQAFEEIRA